MTFTTSAWDRPIQGVSQQPPKVRLPGQCSVQENAVSSVVNGLVKRLGTKRIGSLSETLEDGTKYYYYNRGSGERYVVIFRPFRIPDVYDIDGNKLTVENEVSNTSYLTTENPDVDFKVTTISDFTFIANRTIAPQASTTKTPGLVDKAIINLQFADYGREYAVFIDGVKVAYYMTPDGADAPDIEKVDTSFVMGKLFSDDKTTTPGEPDLVGLNHLTDFNATLVSNTIVLERFDSDDFSISTKDGADGRDLFVVKNSVKEVTDLPLYAPDNYVVEVVGTGSSTEDNYWLRAESTSGGTVRWVETTGPNQSVGFDNTTMPHVLIRDRFVNGLAVFKLQQGPWSDRDAGDETSNPFPSFIEDSAPITSIGTFQNRLYLTAGESVVYSRSNFFFQFFRRSVRTPLDDDPIDVYADTNQVNFLENSAVLDGDVVFFSPNGQFLQAGNEAVTKDNATLQYASTFENISECSPVAAGDVIFFPFEYGRYTGVREFYTDSFTDTKRARPVTDHVDEYIEGRARLLATSTNLNQLFVLSDDEHVVYVYNWLWQGQERVQSSWSKWVFDGNVKYITYDDDIIFLLVERGTTLELEYIEVGGPDDEGLTFSARLDRRAVVSATRQNGNWSVEIPYFKRDSEELVIVRGEGCNEPGVTTTFNLDGKTATIVEDIADQDVDSVSVVVGVRYKMVYQPTMPYIKDRNGRVIDTDRLIINDVNINYDKTGNTKVIVENEWGSTRMYEFNGRVIGSFNNLVGFAPITPGQYSFPVRQESDRVTFRIETESHIPFQLRDMEWRGRFTQRGRRV